MLFFYGGIKIEDFCLKKGAALCCLASNKFYKAASKV